MMRELPIANECRCGFHEWRWLDQRWYQRNPTGLVPVDPATTLSCAKGRGPDWPGLRMGAP